MAANLEPLDIIVFIIFAASVVAIGLWKSRGEKETSEDYFLAGRGLTWPLIGFSLIAANISAEQMVGMSGQSANPEIGLAIASYEWMAAVTLILVGFFFLPTFLRSGIYTIPQFLDQRFTPGARTLMSLIVVFIITTVNVTVVTYLGAKFLVPYVDLGESAITVLSIGVSVIAAVYVAAGGLKACAWADLIQGAALILGGALITWLAIGALSDPDPSKYEQINSAETISRNLGGMDAGAGLGEKLGHLKEDSMSLYLPATNKVLPYTALLLGLWIPNFYYWGLNQYIMQRTLGAKSLAEGQKGIVFAAGLKLIIPFVVCVPGIIAFTLYSESMAARLDESTNRETIVEFAAETGYLLPPELADLVGVGEEGFEVETPEGPQAYPFNDDFALRQPDMARAMFEHNAAFGGVETALLLAAAELGADGEAIIDPDDGEPREPSEVLAAANEEAVGRAVAAGAEAQPPLRGYDYDGAFPLLVSLLAPVGLKGFIIAAVMGAVVSSLASMYNAASTIFTMDVFRNLTENQASQHTLVLLGRICVPIVAAIGAALAPVVQRYEAGAFTFIQEGQGFVFPILGVFLYGIFVKRAPRACGLVGVGLSVLVYGALLYPAYFMEFPSGSFGALFLEPFLNRIAITFATILVVLGIMTLASPLKAPVQLQTQDKVEVKGSGIAKVLGAAVIAIVVVLYIVFR